MKTFLIFRSDRVGDFLLTLILIKSLKRSFKDCKIIVVASEKNYDLIKSNKYVDKAVLFPKKKISEIRRFINLINKEKITDVITADRKNRSIFLSFFIKSEIKIFVCVKFIHFLLLNILRKINVFDNENKVTKIQTIQNILNYYNILLIEQDKNIYNKNDFDKFHTALPIEESFLVLHFDEKWFVNKYIKKYKQINANKENLNSFIESLVKKTMINIVITTGNMHLDLLEEFKKECKIITGNLFEKSVNKKRVFIIDRQNFFQVCSIVCKCKIFIGCHGSLTHLAGSFNAKIVDIIEENKANFYQKYTDHLKNYNKVFRDQMSSMSKKIIECV
ncbi:MAG: hypothetical protein CBD76_02755 [Pelagibacteraceae bacterium TMED216]|nr:MAG: hypothetical protein CBD76_04220 [Pelagibacteraceae bacterium TMED216]OUW73735.1 MAG: hypothetical protein CBD76_02755 [Pelagibacteraceae bacterium TMED216]|tara:strand:- start:923 stop:1921 length:999 start_codon:yes stop_codon:yes gene_type:complete